MSERLLKYGITSYVSGNALIVPFQADFYVEVLHALREEVLEQLYAKPALKALIIDISKVSLLDISDMHRLEEILEMASIYGATGFLVGLQPMVALALVSFGYDSSVNTALTIEQAIKQVNHEITSKLEDKTDELSELEDI